MNSIDFYFDFSSPYGYFSSTLIDSIADRYGRSVAWHPYLMGAVMKITDRKPLVRIPLVDKYSLRDLPRTARLTNIPFKLPTQFPIATVVPCRAFYWLNQRDPGAAKQLAQHLFSAYFADDELISQPEVVIEVAKRAGVDASGIADALSDSEVKQLVRDATDHAISNSVFGSPYFVIDGEPFWGHDRLGQIEMWLDTGGW